MNDALVSVIIPVYKVEKYLRQCVDSVLAQTYHNLEIILIDDGSPDSSGDICEEYAGRDSRIRVIHQENGGLSKARNTGLSNAHGEYITFIDSDDFVDPRYVETLLKMTTENDASISCIDFKYFRDNDITTPDRRTHYIHISDNSEYLEGILYQAIGNTAAWGRLYKNSVFETERFTEGILYEDLDLIYRLLLSKGKVVWSDAKLYYYRKNPQSILHSFSIKRSDVLDVTDRMADFMAANCRQLLRAARSRRLSAHFNIYCLMAANGFKDDKLEKRCIDVIKEERRSFLTDPKIRFKNRLGILITYIGGFRLLRLLGSLIYR